MLISMYDFYKTNKFGSRKFKEIFEMALDGKQLYQRRELYKKYLEQKSGMLDAQKNK